MTQTGSPAPQSETPTTTDHEGNGSGDATDTSALLAAARAWADQDIDHHTRAEARRLISAAETGDAASLGELQSAFSGRLAFGTAGLRGRLGAGPMRMNRVVVSQTSAGFAAFLHERAARTARTVEAVAGTAKGRVEIDRPSIVIGYDGRVNSQVFARDTAEVMAGAGIRVFLLPEMGPTPLTAFAVRHLDVSAGVMITASHNPPRDNGYKVYLGDGDGGSQIVAPADSEIAERIDEIAARPVTDIVRSSDYTILGPGVANAYVAETASAILAGLPESSEGPGVPVGAGAPLKVVYTAMHGVGSAIARRVFLSAGLPSVTPVAPQDQPDGAFPTVSFPNPEEPGALDLAMREARSVGADLIVAHDPDADRLAIAAPHKDAPGGYRRLTGNELGLLLGWRAAERERARAAVRGADPKGTLACTIVSSPALRAVAAEYGLGYAETLSGFKWVSRVPSLLFGFEEALGYLTHPTIVRDKDGISASADAIAMVRELTADGRTVWDLLDEAGERFGHFASGQVTVRLDSMDAAATLSGRVREQPPQRLGEVAVSRTQDLLTPGLAEVPADVLRYDLEDGSRVMFRPSGTEPKLKVYLDTFCDEGNAADRRDTAEHGLAQLERAVHDYLETLQRDAS